ncbi:DUF4214 domain-containing protein [Labrys miyagiensis]
MSGLDDIGGAAGAGGIGGAIGNTLGSQVAPTNNFAAGALQNYVSGVGGAAGTVAFGAATRALGGALGGALIGGEDGAEIGAFLGGPVGAFGGGLAGAFIGAYYVGYVANKPVRREDIELPNVMWSAGTGFCFPGNAKIQVGNDQFSYIRDIKPGDIVLSFSGSNSTLVFKKVTRIFRGITSEWMIVNSQIVVTPGHRFLNENGKFERIDSIVARGGSIVSAHGATTRATAVYLKYNEFTRSNYEEALGSEEFVEGTAALSVEVSRGWRTYNFEVEELHTYIADGFRVHNDSVSDYVGLVAGLEHNSTLAASFSTITDRYGLGAATAGAWGNGSIAAEDAQNVADKQQNLANALASGDPARISATEEQLANASENLVTAVRSSLPAPSQVKDRDVFLHIVQSFLSAFGLASPPPPHDVSAAPSTGTTLGGLIGGALGAVGGLIGGIVGGIGNLIGGILSGQSLAHTTGDGSHGGNSGSTGGGAGTGPAGPGMNSNGMGGRASAESGENMGGKPVILDLDGNGLKVTSLSSSTQFVEENGDGYQNRTAWAGAGDGVLVFDADHDGKISEEKEYVFTDWDPSATSDLQAIKDVFDTNHNGKLDAGDANWSDFKVMVNGQMVSLASLGITSIDLTPTGSGQTFNDGSAITGTTTYTKSDGTTGQVGDATLASDSNSYVIHQSQTTNADGSVTTDILGYNADGSEAFENVVTVSANGLSKTIKYDDNGDGVFDRSQTDTIVSNGDGSSTETISDFNADSSLRDKTATTTSADTKTVTTTVDQNGDGIWDQSQVFVRNTDGSTSTTTKNLAANGTVINQTQVTTSTDGLSKTTKADNSGSGTFDQITTDVTVINGDNSRTETITDTGNNGTVLDKTVIATSADARSKTVQTDHSGSGTFDLVTTSSITVNADNSITTTVQDKNADGSLRDETVTTISADGLSKSVSEDLNSDGSFDQVSSDVTVVGGDASRTETMTDKSGNGTLLSQTVTVTSGDRKTITTTTDSNGDGAVDQTKTIVVNADGSTTTTISNFAPNGTLINRSLITSSANGLSTTTKTDINGDGTYDSVTTDVIVANADGSRTETVSDTSANGTLIDKTIATTTADGLTQTRQQDLNGDATIDRTTVDAIVLNGDGSRIETVSTTSNNGTLLSKTVTTDSADRLTTTVTSDANGDGHVDQTQVGVRNADGSTTKTVTNTAINGALVSKTVTTTTANGLSTTTQTDVDGDGVYDGSSSDVVVLNADGSRTETKSSLSGGGALLSKSVLTTSGNGLSITRQGDANGDGVFDSDSTDVTVLNANGSKTETVSKYNGAGSALISKIVTTTSGNGLSEVTTEDLDGDGTVDLTISDAVALNADGSKQETKTTTNANGTLIANVVTTTSADRKTATVASDLDGNGVNDITSTAVVNADGSTTTTVSTYNASGTLTSTSTKIVSANGLSTTTQTDLDGNGTIDLSTSNVTVVNADGSKTETLAEYTGTTTLKNKVILATSASGLSVVTTWDDTGDGIVDRTRTDTKTLNTDGSITEVVTNTGSQANKTTTTVSANQLTTTVTKDIDGNGTVDQTILTQVNADASTLVSSMDGTVKSASGRSYGGTNGRYETDSANGLSKTIYYDANGDGLAEQLTTDVTVINADGSKVETITDSTLTGGVATSANPVYTATLKDKEIITTSADGLTTASQYDLTGTGSFPEVITSQLTYNADGSTTQSLAESHSGVQSHRYMTTTSGDGLVKTIVWEGNNDSSGHQSELYRLYHGFFDRDPDWGGYEDYLAQLDGGTATPEDIASDFLDSSEFDEAYGSPSDSDYITLLYQNALGRSPTTAELAQWQTSLDGGMSRPDLALAIIDSPEGISHTQAAELDWAVSAHWITGTTRSESDDVTVLNGDGSTTQTITNTRLDGSLMSSATKTTSADGRTVWVQEDTTGSGSMTQGHITYTSTLADGSTQTTVNDLNADWSLKDTVTTTVSADGLVTTIKRDANGDGTNDETEVITRQVDGSSSDVTTDYNYGGTMLSKTTETTSSDGLTSNYSWDFNGDGVTDNTRSIVRVNNADGSTTETVKDYQTSTKTASGWGTAITAKLLMTTVTTVSADGRTHTTTLTYATSTASTMGVGSIGSNVYHASYTSDTGAQAVHQTISKTIDNIDNSTITTSTNDATSKSVKPMDGKVLWNSVIATSNKTVASKIIATTSADGLTTTIQADYDGNGTYEHTENWQTQIDGSQIGTMQDVNSTGVVKALGTETISADGLITTLSEDSDNNGTIDHIDTATTHADGSITETVTDYKTDGTLKQTVVKKVAADGQQTATVTTTPSTTVGGTATSTAVIVGSGLSATATNSNDTATITGNYNILSLDTGTDTASITGTGNVINIGNNVTLTVTGGTSDILNVNGTGDALSVSSATINITDDASATVTGASNTVNVTNDGTVSTTGNTNAVTATGGGATVTMKGATGGKATMSNGTLNLGTSTAVLLTGSGNAIKETGSDALTGTGTGGTLDVTGITNTATLSSAAVTVEGGGVLTLTGTSDTVTLKGNAAQVTVSSATDTVDVVGTSAKVTVTGGGGQVTLENGASATVVNNTNAITLTSNTSLTASGTGNTITVNGTGNTITGSSETINISAGASATVTGATDTVGITGNGALTISGNTAHVTATGTGGSVTFASGTGGTATISGGTVTLANAISASVTGSNDTVNFGHGGSVTVTGSNDTFVFKPSFGLDTVTGYQASGTGADQINIDHTVFADWATLLSHTTQSGTDTIITADASDKITLKNTTVASLQQSNFHFT